MYCVLDIESSGGAYGKEKIIEIAIYRVEGGDIVDQFISMVNPQTDIHFYVQKLTGITSKMVRTAPKFHEIAKRIVEITDNTVLVGHNVAFDFRMLRQEFSHLGYLYHKKILDTIEISQQLLPGQETYSLGKLAKSLGIPLHARHRAAGDAMATLNLFKLLLEKDSEKNIQKKFCKEFSSIPVVEKSYLAFLKDLPHQVGVYYFYDDENNIIYIGHSLNIKQKVNQHFVSQKKKEIKIHEKIKRVSYQLTGNGLIAQIKQWHEVRQHKTPYNKDNHILLPYVLVRKEDEKGNSILAIDKNNFKEKYILAYQNLRQAKTSLRKLKEKYKIEEKNNYILQTEASPENNEKIQQLVTSFVLTEEDYLVLDKGRSKEEKSFIWISQGNVMGYGYYQFDYQVRNKEILKKIITPIPLSTEINELVIAELWIRNLKYIVI